MRALILAAGLGKRMRELTLDTPKPLLKVAGKYLIEYSIENLVKAGITEIVINVSYQAERIKQALGNGSRYGATFLFSEEDVPLETGGGIFKALPLLRDDVFLVVSSDILSDYPLQNLPRKLTKFAHLVLTDNPCDHARGDFGLAEREGLLDLKARPYYTFASMGIYHKELFRECLSGYFPLSQLLFPAIHRQFITGEYYSGRWFNVGTPEILQIANRFYSI